MIFGTRVILPLEKSNKEISYMQATGIVRRIDNLGQVIIPKEIRRTMRIREGELQIIGAFGYKD